MHKFIEKRLREVYSDFMKEVEETGELCVLKKLRFDGSNIPAYSLKIVQQLYLLRYFPAYLIEYYRIYKKLLDFDFLEFPLKVLSIGSGCGVDYYGAVFALKECRKKYSDLIIYTGVDRVDWKYAYQIDDGV